MNNPFNISITFRELVDGLQVLLLKDSLIFKMCKLPNMPIFRNNLASAYLTV